jgi:pyruvate dehydrogenase E1 component beta subunit
MSKVFFREAIIRAFVEEMTRDERVILLGQDIGAFGGSYKETRGIYERFGGRRVRDMPVAEAATVGMAVGAAASGLRPVAFITYMDFLMLGLDPLVNYGAKVRYKTGGQLTAPLVVKATAGAKGQGVAHSQAIEAWLMSVPGLKVVVPSTPRDAYGLLKSAIRDDGPVVFVDHKRLFPTAGEVPDEEELIPLGKAALRREGTDVTIVSHGYMATLALQAAEHLAREGVSADMLDLRSLAPLDTEAVCASVARTGAVLFVEEGQRTCGVGAELAFVVRERVPHARVARLAAMPAPISSNAIFEAFCLPDSDRIREAVLSLLRDKVAV